MFPGRAESQWRRKQLRVPKIPQHSQLLSSSENDVEYWGRKLYCIAEIHFHSCISYNVKRSVLLKNTFHVYVLQAGSSSDAILSSMSQELVPATPQALNKEKGEIVLSG